MVTINQDRLEELCRRHDIALLRIFGSAARDDSVYLRHILDSIERRDLLIYEYFGVDLATVGKPCVRTSRP
jgi:hypothetical protein